MVNENKSVVKATLRAASEKKIYRVYLMHNAAARQQGVESRKRQVSLFVGKPDAVKVARPVWARGKGRDNFKALPMSIDVILEEESDGSKDFI
jgi:hypothetical protein